MIVLSLLAAPAAAAAQSASPAGVRVAPQEVQVAVGQSVDVAVEVVGVSDLYAIDVLLSYDPQRVEVVDLDPELEGVQVQLGSLLEPGFVILNLVDNSLGRLRFVMTQLNPATPKSGTGSLMVVRLRGKSAGVPAAIEVLGAKLASPTGVEIPVNSIENGQVEVVQSISGPTNTPIPAQPPGTPMPTPEPPTAVPQGATAAPTFPPTPTRNFLSVQPTSAVLLPASATPPGAATATTLPTAPSPESATPTPTGQATSAATQAPAATELALAEPPLTPTAGQASEAAGDPTHATATPQATLAVATQTALAEPAPDPAQPSNLILLGLALPAGAFLALVILFLTGAGLFLFWRLRSPGGK